MTTAVAPTEEILEKTAARFRERGIVVPTLAQMKDPTGLVPDSIKERLKTVGMNDIDPLNLFRITWKNEPVESGGQFNEGNWVEFPEALTGVRARLIGIVGKHFPTGSHKVGAAFACLVPRLVTGEFDPTEQKAVWPSTGNYCRGGAFDSAIMGCTPIAILPEEMSRERFEWLKSIGAEVIATPGCESNVKEIYDECWNIRRTRKDCVIFNQFDEFGNSVWHYHVTGGYIGELFENIRGENDRLSGFVSATGSAGTIAAGDYLRTISPHIRVVAAESLQCPTLFQNGFGGHRIEGIGDKHVPWIHNVRNTDVISAIDDEACIQLMRLFNEAAGREYLSTVGVGEELIAQLPLVGISGVCNMLSAIKLAKYFEYDSRDVIFFPLTDSMELYQSRLEEVGEAEGAYSAEAAARHHGRYLQGCTPDTFRELGYHDRKALHNLKYFTWVEQQGKTIEALDRLWDPDFWTETFNQAEQWDRQIEEFNQRVGLS